MTMLQNANAISAGGYDINNSLRFRSSASAYLSRTFAGSPTTFTLSMWVKRGTLGTRQELVAARGSGGTAAYFEFNSSDQLNVTLSNVSGNSGSITTTAVYRDPSAWYHIMLTSASSGTTYIYVNGTQIGSASVGSGYFLFTNTANYTNTIGQYGDYNGFYFDGYMADVYFIDGSAKTPSDFGSTDATTGVWKPKAYSGTYGTNGFYLKFSDIATTSGSNAGLGKDFSGNTNYWTTNNISVTSGTTYDAMTDSPTNTSATVANYAVLNPLSNLGTAQTLSEGNLKLTNTSSTWGSKFSTIGVSSGKWYAEFTVLSTSLNIVGIISDADTTITGTDKYLGSTANSYGYFHSNGNKFNNGTGSAYGATYTTNDVIGVALDMDNGTLTFYKNGTSQGTAYSSLSGVFYIGCSVSSASSSSFAANFGQRPFQYSAPSGYVALNTYNLT